MQCDGCVSTRARDDCDLRGHEGSLQSHYLTESDGFAALDEMCQQLRADAAAVAVMAHVHTVLDGESAISASKSHVRLKTCTLTSP